MSEKKPKEYNSQELENVLNEIQRVAVNLMNAGATVVELEKKMEKLQARRNELRGGQKLFTLEDDKK